MLWHVCRRSSFETLKLDKRIINFLINLGADVNNKAELFNTTPLMVACSKNNLELVKFLVIEYNANVNETDNNGENCLFYASK